MQNTLKVCRLVYRPIYLLSVKKFDFQIATSYETAKYLKKTGRSLARFGDGEINLIFNHKSIGFQPYSDSIRKDLSNVAIDTNKSLCIGLPHGFLDTDDEKKTVASFWWSYVTRNQQNIKDFVLKSHRKQFLDTNFSRTVTELKNTTEISDVVSTVKSIWSNRPVLIVEGEGTRFGVGNGLLSNAGVVSRIVAPAEDAYSVIDKIVVEIEQIIKRPEYDTNPILLVALGPTATIICSRMSKKVQSIDIGHFDLQFEYLKQGKFNKTEIKSRYDNEMANGSAFSDVRDDLYDAEIVSRVD